MPGPSQPGQMRLRAVAGLCLSLKPGGAGRVPHTGRGCPRWRRPRTGLSRGADRRRRLPGPRDHSVSWQFPPSALRGFGAIGPFQWMRHRRSRAGFINREKFEENFRGGPGAPRPPAEEGQVPPDAEDADWNRQRPAASGTRPPQGGGKHPPGPWGGNGREVDAERPPPGIPIFRSTANAERAARSAKRRAAGLPAGGPIAADGRPGKGSLPRMISNSHLRPTPARFPAGPAGGGYSPGPAGRRAPGWAREDSPR